jgi:hypothetical protein
MSRGGKFFLSVFAGSHFFYFPKAPKKIFFIGKAGHESDISDIPVWFVKQLPGFPKAFPGNILNRSNIQAFPEYSEQR